MFNTLEDSDPTPVQPDDLPGEIGVLISEMVDQIRHFLGSAQTAGRNLIHKGDQIVLLHPLIHLCVNGAAGHGIDLDIACLLYTSICIKNSHFKMGKRQGLP